MARLNHLAADPQATEVERVARGVVACAAATVVDRSSFVAWIERLEATMHERFGREEGVCGFFAFLCAASPRYATFVEHLRDDHRRIASRLRLLRVDALDPRISAQELIVRVDETVACIHAHETLEYEVLADALDT